MRARGVRVRARKLTLSYTILLGPLRKLRKMSSNAMLGPSWQLRTRNPRQMRCGQKSATSPAIEKWATRKIKWTDM